MNFKNGEWYKVDLESGQRFIGQFQGVDVENSIPTSLFRECENKDASSIPNHIIVNQKHLADYNCPSEED